MLRVALFVGVLSAVLADVSKFEEVFTWRVIDYAWPKPEDRQAAVDSGAYVPENNAIAGIKLWRDRMYLTVPRWRSGVPVTLAATFAVPRNNVDVTDLEAFPSWAMQKEGDCEAFQFVQSMEIDPKGRMWVLDTGRTEIWSASPKTKCPPRLVILDLERDNIILRSYVFPREVASPEDAYLNDIVLDHEDGGLAYITDAGKEDPGIIVYSLRNHTSWKVRHDRSMRADPNATIFKVLKTVVQQSVNVDGIALSPPGQDRRLYYSPLSSMFLYSIPTSALKSASVDVDRFVETLGSKLSQTDGMAMSRKGTLFYGKLANDEIVKWVVNTNLTTGQRVVGRDHKALQWPDTFAFDESGHLWCTTNSLQNFINGKVDVNATNYRVLKKDVGATSYQYLEDGSVPEMPVLEVAEQKKAKEEKGREFMERKVDSGSGAERLAFALANCLVLCLVFLVR